MKESWIVSIKRDFVELFVAFFFFFLIIMLNWDDLSRLFLKELPRDLGYLFQAIMQ